MESNNLTKSEKFLIAVYSLSPKSKRDITIEDVAIFLWKKYPKEYCLRGYPQYPNADIQKHATKLFNENLMKGGVYGYKLTIKGKEYSKRILNKSEGIIRKKGSVSSEERGYIKKHIERILKTKVFNYYEEDEKLNLVESDLFEFMGTNARSLNTRDKKSFLTQYNIITKDIIPYCEKSNDEYHKKIVSLWDKLLAKFQKILNKK